MTNDELLEMTWATHEAFRKLGIVSEDIFVVSAAGPKGDRVFVHVRQDEAEFDFVVGERVAPAEEFEQAWTAFAIRVNAGEIPDAELERAYAAWIGQVDVQGLAAAMMRKGLRIGSTVGVERR